MESVVRILIVDDSAFIRKSLKQIFSRSPFLEVVGAARDGEEALELVETLNPDVVTLDLNMPRLDGLGFLREQMARRVVPVIVFSSIEESAEPVLQALEAGAIDVVQKPTALANERVFEIADELISKVKVAALARVRLPERVVALPAGPPLADRPGKGVIDIVVIGVSTGGPQALKYLLHRLPADFPVPLAIVIHMPLGYTELYSRTLNQVSHLDVVEAREGDVLRRGLALVSPAGRHLSFRRAQTGEVTAHLDLYPLDTPHRPSVDVLFHSAAEVFGSRVLGVVMTGMGSDGTKGAAWLKARRGMIFSEAEETCVVYGMPRSVV